MQHPEQLIIVNQLMRALAEVRYLSECVPHETIRDLTPGQISDLCNYLKDLSNYSKSVRTMCFTENLFEGGGK